MSGGAGDWADDPDFQYLAVDRKKLMKEQTQAFDGKKACWVPDEKEGFTRAEIQSTKGEEVTVMLEKNRDVSHCEIHFKEEKEIKANIRTIYSFDCRYSSV